MGLKVCIVHKFFTDEEHSLWYELRNHLKTIGAKILTPEPRIADGENSENILQTECDAIRECDCVIIWTDSLDSGANFMWGMSFAMKKDILTFSRGKLTGEHHPIFKLARLRHFRTELDLILFLVEQIRIGESIEKQDGVLK